MELSSVSIFKETVRLRFDSSLYFVICISKTSFKPFACSWIFLENSASNHRGPTKKLIRFINVVKELVKSLNSRVILGPVVPEFVWCPSGKSRLMSTGCAVSFIARSFLQVVAQHVGDHMGIIYQGSTRRWWSIPPWVLYTKSIIRRWWNVPSR